MVISHRYRDHYCQMEDRQKSQPSYIFDVPETMLLTSGALLLSLEVEGRLEAACRPLAPLPPSPPAPPLPLKKKGTPEEAPLSPMAEGGRGLVEAEKGSGSVERE